MIHEFEGSTEQEAIAKAMAALGLDENEFDVEIMEEAKKGLFSKGKVKIRIHVDEDGEESSQGEPMVAMPELEKKLTTFIETVIRKMGFTGRVVVTGREDGKLHLDLQSPDANLLIGKHGKNLDALQVLVNVYGGNLYEAENTSAKVVLDSENYRSRREEHLVRLAHTTASQVRRSGTSKLLEPMNPFERRLIHTALNDLHDIRTESEGEGLIKQVRVMYVETR
jgi:spoIIIJ-associated protein